MLRSTLAFLANAGPAATDHDLGDQGEDAAYWYLREQGYIVVSRNYRQMGGGEVDLIAWDGDTLVFVEVKTCASDFRAPEDAVGEEKRRRLIAAARDYRYRAHIRAPYRFDVISVQMNSGQQPLVEHFRSAFTEADAVHD